MTFRIQFPWTVENNKSQTEECEEEPKAELEVMQVHLNELEPGDIVFHKTCGYGRIINLDWSRIAVTFDSGDRKGNPHRSPCFRARSSKGYYG